MEKIGTIEDFSGKLIVLFYIQLNKWLNINFLTKII